MRVRGERGSNQSATHESAPVRLRQRVVWIAHFIEQTGKRLIRECFVVGARLLSDHQSCDTTHNFNVMYRSNSSKSSGSRSSSSSSISSKSCSSSSKAAAVLV